MPDRFPRLWANLLWRLILLYAVLAVGLIAVLGIGVRSSVRSALVDQLTTTLERDARSLRLSLGMSGDLQSNVEAQAEVLDARVTVIGIDGVVLADSAEDPSVMENHGDRPEVVEAIAGSAGVDRRRSATLGDNRLYVAAPPTDEVLVRLSVTEAQIEAQSADVSRTIQLWSVAVALIGIVVVVFVARRIAKPIGHLTELAGSIAEGQLEVRPHRSGIAELDQLGQSLGSMASELDRRIKESEAGRRTLEAVLNQLPQGVMLIEPDQSIAYLNPAAVGVVGRSPLLVPELSPHVLQRLIAQAGEEGSGQEVFESGSPVRIYEAAAVRFDEARILVVLDDVTEAHRLESARRSFVSDASHELKTPVSAILASAEALDIAVERGSDRIGEFAGRITSASQQLSRIVTDLLDLSRLESAEIPAEEVLLGSVARAETDALAGRFREKRVELTTSLSPVAVTGSPADLGLAVRNLLVNALAYTDPGGRVYLRIHQEENTAVVEVEDTGTGIPSRSTDRVFERFYRVDQARSRRTGGTGLGLAIVKHVAETHGGSVSVTSELGSGSTFRLMLPANRMQ